MNYGEDPDFISESSSNYELRDTEYVSEQLEFMECVKVNYPSDFSETWEDNIVERYESLVDAFGNVDEYISHQNDGSIEIVVGRKNDLLFELQGEEKTNADTSRFGFSSIVDSLSG